LDLISRDGNFSNFHLHSDYVPHTFSVKVRTPDLLPKVAQQIAAWPVIDDVRYSGKMIEQIRSLVDAVRIGGAALVILISFATLLIVVNTVRLTVLARETDIAIMKLVGAGNSFVTAPFIIEGIMYAISACIISIMITYPILNFIQPYLNEFFGGTFDLNKYFTENFLMIFGIELLGVIILNIISSGIAVRRYLKI